LFVFNAILPDDQGGELGEQIAQGDGLLQNLKWGDGYAYIPTNISLYFPPFSGFVFL
jgi:hypothetical protein